MTNEKTIYIERLDKGFVYKDIEGKTNAISNWDEMRAEIILLVNQVVAAIENKSVKNASIKISVDTNLPKIA